METVKALEDEASSLQENRMDVSRFVALLKEYTSISTLDRQVLTALIDRITISKDKKQQGKRNRLLLFITNLSGRFNALSFLL